ncbi:uncharacterized protein LOC100888651 [Strongylocentrotus purpuratus]|uniref:Uncharacterized protein n=1 Tax=Strongylocentrotus purpuratus TaxID=7668 RepID=A0A7M7GHD7_STRPU|nr:uncharacterized protein LOC100888651 [Strongylocentrotus purpuratus]|eukprot:XP_003729245.1 PREDICTED: uncharacterized protein LOC100888651 [Strongylocentrotus purpuratus]
MDHKHQFLESCQNPTSLNATTLDDELTLDDVFSDNETIAEAASGQGIPKTSTPAKKNAAGTDSPRMQGTRTPERRADVTESATRDVEAGGAEGGAKDEVNHQVYQVPEPVASISPIGLRYSSFHLASGAGDLRNPDIIPARSEAIEIPSAASSWSSELSSVLHSVSHIAEGHEKLSKGYHSHCVRSNTRHTKSVENMRSLRDSVSSHEEEMKAFQSIVAALKEDMRKLKAKDHYTYQKTSYHVIPYDDLKYEQASQILLSTDDNLRAELFLLGFGSGHGTHLSLKVTGDLPTRCHFEARVVNSSDDEETRKKSTDFEETSGAHIVEFPKLIEKDVVENEALGYKMKGMLKITLIVSWDEVITP